MKFFFPSLIFVLILTLHGSPAQASSFYYELQAGLSEIRGGAPFFGSDTPSPLGWGLATHLSLAYSFTGGEVPAEFQIGLQQRYSSGINGDTSHHSFSATYPIFRLQLSRAFIGVGATPFTFSRSGVGAGFDSFKFKMTALAYLVEAGVLWPVAPIFSIGAVGSAQFINEGGQLSPNPIAEATLLLRFYFGFSSGHSGGSSSGGNSNEFKGWRYPFGNSLQ